MFTLLPLFDLVYSVPTARFSAPFSALGQTPEGCSTFTFQKIFGRARTTEILILGRAVTAAEAVACGLVRKTFPSDQLLAKTLDIAHTIADLPQGSVLAAKRLLCRWDRDTLLQVNHEETRVLEERWKSQECMEAVVDFLCRKSKL